MLPSLSGERFVRVLNNGTLLSGGSGCFSWYSTSPGRLSPQIPAEALLVIGGASSRCDATPFGLLHSFCMVAPCSSSPRLWMGNRMTFPRTSTVIVHPGGPKFSRSGSCTRLFFEETLGYKTARTHCHNGVTLLLHLLQTAVSPHHLDEHTSRDIPNRRFAHEQTPLK